MLLKKKRDKLQNELSLISQSVGWVAGAERLVELYEITGWYLMVVADCGDYFIAPHGETIQKLHQSEELSQSDREVLLGPALVLALALRDVWSLHASAGRLNNKTVAFLGESGQGKSTLAAFLSSSGWQLVADDIMPVTIGPSGMIAWPHFPQLKLTTDLQPGPQLSEQIPLNTICLLELIGESESPEIHPLTIAETVKTLLAHTAGTLLFPPEQLRKHLEFCTRSAEKLTAYKISYPHRGDALPIIKKILEKLC